MSKLRDKKIIEYLHDYRFNSLLVRSFLIILIFLIVTFTAVMIAVSDEMRGIITDEVGNMSINALEKTKERVDAVMDEVVSISAHLSIDSDVRRLLVSDTGESPGHMQAVAIKQKMEMYTDVFDYIDFDLGSSASAGRSIVTNLNGRPAQFMEPLKEGDVIEIYWKNLK